MDPSDGAPDVNSQCPTTTPNHAQGKTIYGQDALELYAIDRSLVSALVARLERRVAFSVSVSDRELCVSIGSDQLAGRVVRLRRDA